MLFPQGDTMTIKPRLAFLALAALMFLLAPTSLAGATESTDKPTIVKIHANWCGTCQRIEGTWDQLKATYGDNANFVVFDVTDKESVEKSKAEAQKLGLTGIFDEYKSRTGTIAVVGPDGETVTVFKGVSDPTRYDDAIGQACTS
jgi:thiol-disulfide isomerase/thioredoxin